MTGMICGSSIGSGRMGSWCRLRERRGERRRCRVVSRLRAIVLSGAFTDYHNHFGTFCCTSQQGLTRACASGISISHSSTLARCG